MLALESGNNSTYEDCSLHFLPGLQSTVPTQCSFYTDWIPCYLFNSFSSKRFLVFQFLIIFSVKDWRIRQFKILCFHQRAPLVKLISSSGCWWRHFPAFYSLSILKKLHGGFKIRISFCHVTCKNNIRCNNLCLYKSNGLELKLNAVNSFVILKAIHTYLYCSALLSSVSQTQITKRKPTAEPDL